jgi:ribosome-associated protein
MTHAMPKEPVASADPETFAAYVARLMVDSHCEDAIVLDVREVSQVTDYFVIGTGTSDRQIRAVSEELEEMAKAEGRTAFGIQGGESAQWIVVDFVDVVVHLFTGEARGYYDLESLWADARRVPWHGKTKPGQFARLAAIRAAKLAKKHA